MDENNGSRELRDLMLRRVTVREYDGRSAPLPSAGRSGCFEIPSRLIALAWSRKPR